MQWPAGSCAAAERNLMTGVPRRFTFRGVQQLSDITGGRGLRPYGERNLLFALIVLTPGAT
jgi:hypothetical protein